MNHDVFDKLPLDPQSPSLRRATTFSTSLPSTLGSLPAENHDVLDEPPLDPQSPLRRVTVCSTSFSSTLEALPRR